MLRGKIGQTVQSKMALLWLSPNGRRRGWCPSAPVAGSTVLVVISGDGCPDDNSGTCKCNHDGSIRITIALNNNRVSCSVSGPIVIRPRCISIISISIRISSSNIINITGLGANGRAWCLRRRIVDGRAWKDRSGQRGRQFRDTRQLLCAQRASEPRVGRREQATAIPSAANGPSTCVFFHARVTKPFSKQQQQKKKQQLFV